MTVSAGEASVRSSTEWSDATPCQSARNAASSSAASPKRTSVLTRPPRARRGRAARAPRTRARRARPGACAGRGRPTSSSATTRPGRGESTATRSASRIASSTSWVTSSTVRGSAASASASHSCIDARVIESSAPNGSSRSSTGRPARSVRRNATRWRIPPDSSAGRARSNSASPKRSNSGSARSRAAAFGGRPGTRARARRCRARRARAAAGRAGACRRTRRAAPRRRSPPMTVTAPASGSCRPATSSSSVDLPQPGRSHDRDHLAGAHLQVEALERDHGGAAPEAARYAAQRDPGALKCERPLYRSLGLDLHSSLRGHYPTGSKGQRRAVRARGRYLSPPPREPPCELATESSRVAFRSARSFTNASSCFVVQHS